MGDTCADTTPVTTTAIEDHDGIAVVTVTGEIDIACDMPVRAAISDQLDRRPAGLVLDLTEVDFFGSAGIQLLVEAVLRARSLGVALAVATDRRTVLHPLEITLVNRTVDIHPTPREAVDALRASGVPASRRVAALPER